MAPRRTDRTTHTWRTSAGEIAPTLGSDLIVWTYCSLARICFNDQARRATDTVSPCLLTAPFKTFSGNSWRHASNVRSKHRLIYLRCAVRPCHCLIGPSWMGAEISWWALPAPGLAGAVCLEWCGVEWCALTTTKHPNAIVYLCFWTDCGCGQQLNATYGSKPLRCETHPLTRCVTCQCTASVKPVGVQKRARCLHSRASEHRSV